MAEESKKLSPLEISDKISNAALAAIKDRKGLPAYYESLEKFGYASAELIMADCTVEILYNLIDSIHLAMKRAVFAEVPSFALKFDYTEDYDSGIILPEYEVDENDPEEWADDAAYEANPEEFSISIQLEDTNQEDMVLEDDICKKSFLAGVAKFFLDILNSDADYKDAWKLDPTNSNIIYIKFDYSNTEA